MIFQLNRANGHHIHTNRDRVIVCVLVSVAVHLMRTRHSNTRIQTVSSLFFYRIVNRLARTASRSFACGVHNFLFSYSWCLTERWKPKQKKGKNHRYLYYLLFCLRASFKSDLRIIMLASANQTVRPIHRKQKRSLFICVVFDNDEKCCSWISCTWMCNKIVCPLPAFIKCNSCSYTYLHNNKTNIIVLGSVSSFV